MATERAAQPLAPWHALSAEEVLSRLESTPGGLAETEAQRRRTRYGPNRLRIAATVPAWRLLADQLRSVVVALLTAAALVALALGELPDSAAIAAVLVINVGLGFWTELGARRAMESLRRLQVQEAVVRRQDGDRPIDAAELVPGDVIVLEAGAGVPADGRLLAATDLRVIEAPLTGESFPADKSPAAVSEIEPLPARTSMVYKGTLVGSGHGLAVVAATGQATEVGRISELVQKTVSERTPLEDRLDHLGRRLIGLTLGVAVVVTGLGILRGGSTWLMVETGLALAIAAVPEGLPVVATITLAVGMHRMARRRAIVRRLPAVEALGSTTIICTDKTGTLTAGEMTVTALHVAGRRVAVTGTGFEPRGGFAVAGEPRPAGEIPGLSVALETGVLANRATFHDENGARRVRGDPTEAALLIAAEKAGIRRAHLVRRLPEVSEVPFSSEAMVMATFHRHPDGRLAAYVKGAPGLLIERSETVWTADGPLPLDESGREELRAANRRLAEEGLRVLGLATKTLAPQERPAENALLGLTFLALAGISDPPAPGVSDAIRSFHRAGVRTVMLTGDQQITAEAVARELGILRSGEAVLDGRELATLGEEELAGRLHRVAAFSRVSPADKVRIVAGLQRRGEIVAMLGDGVNDAPALRRADIGVAMGGRGADLAKETADIVLVDDRFQTIAAAVEEGRVIFDNIRKFIFYLFSCNLSEVLVLFTSVVAGLPLPLLPLQILWLNLVTDVFPALALAMEPAEPDVMRRPPRDPEAAILSRRFLLLIASYSLLLAGLAIAVFSWAVWVAEMELERARTLAFMTLALTQLAHVFNARSPKPVLFGRRLFQNGWVWAAIALTVGMQLAVVYVPALAHLFATQPLGAADWLLVVGCSGVTLILGQLVKARPRRRGGGALPADRR